MNGEQNNQDNYIISKKSKKIDQEEDNSKKYKGKKNKNKNHQYKAKNIQEVEEQILQIKNQSQKQRNRKNMLSQLCDMYPNYKIETVEKYLKESNYNIQIAAEKILETQEDKQCQNQQKVKLIQTKSIKKKNQSKNQIKQELNYQAINDFLGEIYELSGNQFQQLFNQITQMIKQDQKMRGKGQIQINNFVDNCASAKEAILVGMIQVFQMDDDICIDQQDPIYAQTQTFLWDLAIKQQKQEKLKLQDFPTLGSSSSSKGQNKSNQSNQKSIVNKTQQNYNQNKTKKQQPQYFVSNNKNKPIYFDQYKEHSIFNVDNSQRSQDDLRLLHKEYNNVSINRLKIVYKRMEGDFHLCRTFLDKFYGKGKTIQPIQQRVVQSSYQEKRKARINYMKAFRKENQSEIDQQLQQWTYNELRDQIQHLYKLREVFKMTCQKINNANQRKELLRLAQEKAPLTFIRKLSKASRVRLISQNMKNNPLYVDLHGYRQEEVVPVLESLIASIKDQFDKGNQKIHSKVRKIGIKTECILQVMTGKGRHSQYGESVLKPHISDWAKSKELRALTNEDNIEIYIPML